MRFDKSMKKLSQLSFFTFFTFLTFFTQLSIAKPLPPPKSFKAGVIVLAHGGNRTWNEHVRQAVRDAKLTFPVEVVFGMAMHDVEPYQKAVDRLEAKNVERLVVVPLLISSHSEVYQQYRYVMAQRQEPGLPEWKIPQTKPSVPVVFTEALDHDPLVADILLERMGPVSKQPSREVVVLVGHGPNDEMENTAWLNSMTILAGFIKTQGHFEDVRVLTLREDAEPAIKAKATLDLRHVVADWNDRFDVIVSPLLMSEGGIEKGIPERLKGLSYRFKPKGLLPHPKISDWIRAKVDQLVSSF